MPLHEAFPMTAVPVVAVLDAVQLHNIALMKGS
jgi:hypothetical protein